MSRFQEQSERLFLDKHSTRLGPDMYFPAGIPMLLVVALIVWNAREEKLRSEGATTKKPS